MDYYSILNIPKTASQDDVKRSFRRLAMKYHPDRNQNNPEAEHQFKLIKEAYDVLSDPQKRAEYDNPSIKFNNIPPGFNGDIPPDIAEMFQAFGFGFGGFGQRRPQQKNRNFTVRVTVNLIDVLYGKDVVGSFTLPSGEEEALNLKIPRGVKHGDTIRFPNLGDNSIKNIPRGDLIVSIVETPTPGFQRNGYNILTEVQVSVFVVLTGGTVEITNFDNRTLQFKIPPGSNPNTTFACAGQGLPKSNSDERGDLFVKLTLTVPMLTDEDRILIETIKPKYD